MKTTKQLSAVAAVLAALVSTSSFADSADVRFSIGDVSFGIDIGTPPPAPIIEYIPVARQGHVWVPGFWAWNGHRHVWSSGVWEKVRPGYSHVAGHWEQHGKRWHFKPSRWEARKTVERHKDGRGYSNYAYYTKHRDHDSSHNRDDQRDHRR